MAGTCITLDERRMHTDVRPGNLKERGHLTDLGIERVWY
jgi:hypothetical protein